MSSNSVGPALSQGVGYGVVLGVGAAFAIFMISLTHILKRFNNEVQTSEMFTTAGRSVKSGLVAAAVASSWTWAATLLQSTGVCYRYGVSGPFWYASGATVQIILFATLAITLKKRAPNAHTFLEAIRARYGAPAHFTFIFFGLVTNILVSLMLIAGGAAAINALTGMHGVAAIFLMPIPVVAYTFIGGIKATFITDYIHGAAVLIIIITFALTTYATSEYLGSPGAVYDLLVEAATNHPVSGNRDGSYLTMRSTGGVTFFVINIVGNFGTVFLDAGYSQKAIAAHPVHALPGYIMGGLAWFAIPWLTATTLGLSALALESSPRFPTYPNRMTDAEVSAGLALPYAAVALLGQGGAGATLVVVFLAVTSSFNSELIAVSSIVTYDVYRAYIDPNASGKKLVWMSHMAMIVYAVIICLVSVGLWYNGISMGYMYLLMGVLISAAVIPATLTLMWKGQNKWAATLSPILGAICAIVAWLVTASRTCGVLDVTCTGSNNPMLAGNLTALLSPIIFVPIFTLIFGLDKYDWQSMLEIRQADDHEIAKDAGLSPEAILELERVQEADWAAERKKLDRAFKIASVTTVLLAVSLLVLWPMPLYGSGYIFSREFFTGWVVVGIIWIFCSFIAIVIYPLWESRVTLAKVISTMLGLRKPNFPTVVAGEPALSGRATPTEEERKNGDEKIDSSENPVSEARKTSGPIGSITVLIPSLNMGALAQTRRYLELKDKVPNKSS